METQNTVIQNLIEKLEAKVTELSSIHSNSHGMEMFIAGQISEIKATISLLRESLPEEREQITRAFNRGSENPENAGTKEWVTVNQYIENTYKAHNQ